MRAGGGSPIPRRARRRASVAALNFDFLRLVTGTLISKLTQIARPRNSGIPQRYASAFYFLEPPIFKVPLPG